MTSRTVLGIAICGLVLGAGWEPAQGTVILFEFAGTITSVRDDDNLLGGAVTIGTPFSGTYSFESTTPDSDSHPRRGIYNNAITEIVGDVGGVAFTGPVGLPNYIEVHDGFMGPTIDLYTVRSTVDMDGLILYFVLALLDDTGGPFPAIRFPSSRPKSGFLMVCISVSATPRR